MPSKWAIRGSRKSSRKKDLRSPNGAVDNYVLGPSAFGNMQDSELMRQFLAGNEEAFAALLFRYEKVVYRIANRILRDATEAEDTVQIVFGDICTSAKQFDEQKGSFKAWALQFALNRAKNRKRDLQRQGIYKWEPIDEMAERESHNHIRGLSQPAVQERDHLLNECLSSVTSEERTSIELRFFDGLTWRELAKRTDASLSAVRKTVDRGLKKMRAAYKGDI